MLLVSLGILGSARAQDPSVSTLPAAPVTDQSPPPVPIVPPTTPEEAAQLSQQLYPEPPESTPEPSAETNSEQRPWKFTLSAKLGATYDSNIFIAPDHAKGDFIYSLSPGLTFAYGDFRLREENFIILNYDLGIIRFAHYTGEDAIEQQASLGAQMHFARLTLGLTFRFQDLSGPDVDAGDRTRRRLYETALLNRYELSDKTYAELNFQNNVNNYERGWTRSNRSCAFGGTISGRLS